MKDTKEIKFISKFTKKNLLIIVNVILLVALLVISTYAWFYHNLIDEVKTDVVQFDGSSDLEVSLDGTNYAYSKTMELDSASLSKEITGNGLVSSFSRVSTIADTTFTNVLVPNTGSTWDDAKTGDYIIQKIHFRSKQNMTVYLGDGSYVKGEDELIGGALYGPNVKNKSKVTDVKDTTSSGSQINVSKDCIVGATRIAFLDGDALTNKFIWIPRPDLFYMTDNNGVNILKHTEDGSPISVSGYPFPNSDKHIYYSKTKAKETYPYKETGAHTLAGVSSLATTTSHSDSNKLVTLTKTGNDTYYRGAINVVIWVEGCDSEARRAFAGGKFKVYMQFVGADNSSGANNP